MKKPLLPFLLLPFFFADSYSQVKIAITGGPHSAFVKESNDLPGWDSLKNKYTSRTGVHLGFIADIPLRQNSKLFFQPGIIFYNKGRKFSSTYDTATSPYSRIDSRQFINYIDFPLNLVYKHPVGKNAKLFAGAGPYLSFFYNGNEKNETYLKDGGVNTDENSDLPVGNGAGKYKTLDAGINAAAGIEFRKLFLSGNFSRSITDFYTASYNGHFRHQVVGVSLGVFINKPEDQKEKPRDRDQDGIADTEDICPDEPGPSSAQGCPDTDADGIADKTDKCPSVKGVIKYEGCPVPDTDNDGVNDEMDKCATVFGSKDYEGCPIPDTDGDGINDDEDKCREVPGYGRYEGCPIPDRDNDGVNDETDQCPDAAGVKENNGCPAIREELVKKVEFAARRIQFETGNAKLLPGSKKILDEVAVILTENPALQIDIEGHTSSEGDADFNNRLSADRAKSVKDYLVSRGVSAQRLNAAGFGSSRLLNDEKTPAERALNRRVELKLKSE